ncbi:type VI secretion system-associated FHA domain protein TagH [Microbulbifer sp. SSSA005]|uniref:type VI secretion system-associated FHA domain protein TagH n=1 Tax=Microbulbifer sp. SSSA005 TaxID=3243378 RepID=UPI0040393926
MDLILSVLADPSGANMLKHTKLFTKAGGSLGRSADNYWVLPDPDRVVSSKHAQISFTDNQFFLVDTSTNGTYYNDSENPLGKGNQVPLKEGDMIVLGEYKLKVSLRQPKEEGDLPKGLGSADFLDTSDRTTFSADAMAKMQSQAEAKELDSWLEPGSSPQPDVAQTGEWGSIGLGNQANTPTSDSLLTSESGPLDPLAAFGQSDPSGLVGAAPEMSPVGGLVGSTGQQQSSNQWSDDEWWKDGSDDDHVPADQHSMQINPQPVPEPVVETVAVPESQVVSPQPQVPMGAFQGISQQPVATPIPQPQAMQPQPQPQPQAMQSQPLGQPQGFNQQPISPPAQDNPFADSFAAMQGQQVDGAPGFGSGQSSSQPQPQPQPQPQLQPKPNPQPDLAAQAQQFSHLQQSPVTQPTGSSGGSVFASTLGLNMNPVQLQQADQQAAEIVRETVARLIDLLRARNSIKNELRVQRTMIQTEANNPLKFSATERDALEAMFAGTGAFMNPAEAVKDSFDDLSDHQVAVLAGMRAGYNAMLKFFSPENIERRLGNTSGVFGNKNAKKWEGFTAIYRELVGDPDNCYRKLFGDEFAVTYENQLSELKNARSIKN